MKQWVRTCVRKCHNWFIYSFMLLYHSFVSRIRDARRHEPLPSRNRAQKTCNGTHKIQSYTDNHQEQLFAMPPRPPGIPPPRAASPAAFGFVLPAPGLLAAFGFVLLLAFGFVLLLAGPPAGDAPAARLRRWAARAGRRAGRPTATRRREQEDSICAEVDSGLKKYTPKGEMKCFFITSAKCG
jgi:hypothetical protein